MLLKTDLQMNFLTFKTRKTTTHTIILALKMVKINYINIILEEDVCSIFFRELSSSQSFQIMTCV